MAEHTECQEHPRRCERPRGAEVVVTGLPNVQLLACQMCGVLLWDIEAHYAHAHEPNDPHPESADSHADQAGTFGAENHTNGSQA